jgi:hypothetical protein
VFRFGVVIPTKNSLPYLPAHVANLATWIDLAEQVVVVDSFSTDGTVEFLKKNLRHPNLQFVEHPPGLYASWNFGIRQITSEFCYLSTVGDFVTRAGIEHLVATASRLNCDVLVSRPNFVDESGQPCAGPEWPMDAVFKFFKVDEPVALPPAVILATALTHTGGAITGSCASDLFRTRVLQKNPFPTDFGVAGDGAWSLQNIGRLHWAVSPARVTTFRLHPPTASSSEVEAGHAKNRLAQLARDSVTEWLAANSGEACDDLKRLLALVIECDEARHRYQELRRQKWPWFLNPAGWHARSKRDHLKIQIASLMQRICDRTRGPVSPFQPKFLARWLAASWARLGRLNEQKYRDSGWDSYAEKIQFKLLKARCSFSSPRHVNELHRLADDLRSARTFERYCKKRALNGLQRSATDVVTFKHSGNAGDVIYALPALRALSDGRLAKLFLKLDAPINGWSKKEHPLGKSGLTAEMVQWLKPLLEHQPWLASVEIYHDEAVDYDLDLFRQVPNTARGQGNIAHWYFWLFGTSADLSQPWLEVRPPPPRRQKIVLARSLRYRNPALHYGFLNHFGEIDFVGTRTEFEEMQTVLPQLRHEACADFLQLARVIASARFFIGNQSFPYAVAEALKVPRLLEVCPQFPNVIPAGGQTGEAFFQPNFEKLVRQFWAQTAAPGSAVNTASNSSAP